jgi:hypothetical protein
MYGSYGTHPSFLDIDLTSRLFSSSCFGRAEASALRFRVDFLSSLPFTALHSCHYILHSFQLLYCSWVFVLFHPFPFVLQGFTSEFVYHALFVVHTAFFCRTRLVTYRASVHCLYPRIPCSFLCNLFRVLPTPGCHQQVNCWSGMNASIIVVLSFHVYISSLESFLLHGVLNSWPSILYKSSDLNFWATDYTWLPLLSGQQCAYLSFWRLCSLSVWLKWVLHALTLIHRTTLPPLPVCCELAFVDYWNC